MKRPRERGEAEGEPVKKKKKGPEIPEWLVPWTCDAKMEKIMNANEKTLRQIFNEAYTNAGPVEWHEGGAADTAWTCYVQVKNNYGQWLRGYGKSGTKRKAKENCVANFFWNYLVTHHSTYSQFKTVQRLMLDRYKIYVPDGFVNVLNAVVRKPKVKVKKKEEGERVKNEERSFSSSVSRSRSPVPMPPTSREPLLFSLEQDLKEKEAFERDRERLVEEEQMALQQLLINYRRDNPEYSTQPQAATATRPDTPEYNMWLPKTPSSRRHIVQTKPLTKRVQQTNQMSSRFGNQYFTNSQPKRFASQYHNGTATKTFFPPAPGLAKQSKFPTPPSSTHEDEMSLDWLE